MNPFTFWIDVQKAALDAQAANKKATKKGIKALDAAIASQKTMAKAAEANAKLMKDWAKLWGIK